MKNGIIGGNGIPEGGFKEFSYEEQKALDKTLQRLFKKENKVLFREGKFWLLQDPLLEIINPQLLPLFPGLPINGIVYPKNIKEGDTFDLPSDLSYTIREEMYLTNPPIPTGYKVVSLISTQEIIRNLKTPEEIIQEILLEHALDSDEMSVLLRIKNYLIKLLP